MGNMTGLDILAVGLAKANVSRIDELEEELARTKAELKQTKVELRKVTEEKQRVLDLALQAALEG